MDHLLYWYNKVVVGLVGLVVVVSAAVVVVAELTKHFDVAVEVLLTPF